MTDQTKRPIGKIDLTPTWAACMPILIEALQNGTPEGQRLAREELKRLADLVDQLNTTVTGIVREQIFGDGTADCQQRVIDLCLEARDRFGIVRAA